jgi:hypothetical protein
VLFFVGLEGSKSLGEQLHRLLVTFDLTRQLTQRTIRHLLFSSVLSKARLPPKFEEAEMGAEPFS